jgi:predicted nucleotidyltransferase
MTNPEHPSTSQVDAVINAVRNGIDTTLGSSLVGLYVFGSLISGDFESDVSDMDLLAVLTDDPSDVLGNALRQMHDRLAKDHPGWKDRIEVIYVSQAGLRDFRSVRHVIGVISPGEPFHTIPATPQWVVTWYAARKENMRLMGPAIETLIPPISRDEYVQAVRHYMRDFVARVTDESSLGSQAYAILSVCRGLFACRFGEKVSKNRGASWAKEQFPEWAQIIDDALEWRQHQWEPQPSGAGKQTASRTQHFVAQIAALALEP